MLQITGGSLRGRKIEPVPDPRTRYTSSMVRQALFSMIDVSGKSFLELFCGSAVVSIEAISRGARRAVAVDVSKLAVQIARKNAQRLGVDLTVLCMDYRRFLEKNMERFDVVFLDPPYDLDFVSEALKLLSGKDVAETIVVEKSKREKVAIPDRFELIKQRTYGDSELLILRRSPALGPESKEAHPV
ncbi:RsmD family RNA methyltransferase [Thermotoga sp. Ku-13t]|uniref:RsmD family RNA methyltransferase n=1 Tax=Thermotoga sp. Ku-13t TaxID=1755813 RepID=UPI001F49D8E1|nr:RsmD family RNA methyltransferase [Thermotoga sp. Ku-13t]